MDFYKVLNIGQDATTDDIAKAYRELALKYHPDRNSGNTETIKKFKEASEAFETLHDVEKRRRYDLKLKTKSKPKTKYKPNSKGGYKTKHNPFSKTDDRYEWVSKNDPNMGNVKTPPPPEKDIWGKPLTVEQKKQWLRENASAPHSLYGSPFGHKSNRTKTFKYKKFKRKKWRDEAEDFVDVFSKYYTDDETPDLR